jgi:hypothetical protein
MDLDPWEPLPVPAPLSPIGLDQPQPRPPSLIGWEAERPPPSLVEARTEPGAAGQVQELQVAAQQSSVQVAHEGNGVQVSVLCSSVQ